MQSHFLKCNISLEILTESLNYKRRMTYVNNEPFQQFCNQMQNENLILNKFANLSYSITTANLHSTVFSSEDCYLSPVTKLLYKNFLFTKYELEHQKTSSALRTGVTVTIGTKKKLNSKLNTFVYKPKYDKLPKPLFVQQPSATSSNFIFFYE